MFEFLHFSRQHIHGVVRFGVDCESQFQDCFLSGVYVHPELAHREEVRGLIKFIGR